MKTLLTLIIAITISCAIDKSTYISKQRCNQVLEDKYISICYDYHNKSAKAVAYELTGNLVNSLNIKKRPRFYTETRVPMEHRANYKDYTRSGFDRGHLAPDASFDSSKESLHSAYTLANIVPQYPNLNRRSWVKAEK